MPAIDARPGRAVIALTVRLARRSTVAVVIALVLYMVVESLAFQASYPDEVARQALALWAQEPGIRIIAGQGSAVQTLGGCVAWDAGLNIGLALGAWVLALTTRVLRGDEAAGRSDLLLVRPVTATRMLILQVGVLMVGCVLAGAAIGVSLAAFGAQAGGTLLYAVMTAGYCAALVALAALASQVFPHRRTALGAAAAAFAGLVLLRLVGNSSDDRSWLTWLTPAGWVDGSQAFGDNHWWVAAVPVLVVSLLLVGAVAARRARDAGAGLLTERGQHRSRTWGLRTPTAFALRSNAGVLAAWTAGMAVAGLVLGALLPTIADVLATDTGFRQLLAQAGLAEGDLTRSFVALWASVLGLALTLYGVLRVGAMRAEEASGHLDLLLARPLTRWRWLAGHLLWLVVGLIVLAATSATMILVSATVADANLDPGDPLRAIANMLPAVVLISAGSVLLFGLSPRLAVPVGIGVTVTTYVLALVGPVLSWPAWLVGLSPFHHLANVPVEAVAWPEAWGMAVIALVLSGAGVVAFERRDLVGE